MAVMLMLALVAQAGSAAPVTAPAALTCPAGTNPAELPPVYAGWSAMQGVTAGSSVAAPTTLALGRSARATLVPDGSIKFAVSPEKPAAAGSNGGLFAFDVVTAGTYRIALGGAAWIDVVAGDKALASVAHGHGPDCSGVRKIVDFKLIPGRYLVQVSGYKGDTLAVMAARVDG